MNLLQEILNWSASLPDWQKDAIARLYENRTLTGDDVADLYALLKSSHGIADPQGRVPKALRAAQVQATPEPTRVVRLTGLKEVRNVNALANGGTLPIAEAGLTVIYGENGAGKSGYSRILKHACRARDTREKIQPNARIPAAQQGTPSVVFVAKIDGADHDLAWTYGSPSPEPLSDIAIFDTHCARAYVDNHGDFAYVPYGLDILEGLASACAKVKVLANQELVANATSDAAYSFLTGQQTAVAAALKGIPTDTTSAMLVTLARMTQDESDRLALVTKSLAETNPMQKAQWLREKTARIDGLKGRIASALPAVSGKVLQALQEASEHADAARRVAQLAASDFANVPGQLPRTGSNEWKALFEAARTFAALSHAEHLFPSLPPQAPCPLCQNPLGQAGSERLARFDAFIAQESERAARRALETRDQLARALQAASVDLAFDDALAQELRAVDPDVADACERVKKALNERKSDMLLAALEGKAWDAVAALPDDPSEKLAELSSRWVEEAIAFDASADERARTALETERLELDARARLGQILQAVLDEVSKHELCAKLRRCIEGLSTAAISRKSTELSRSLATEDLAKALNQELELLKVTELQAAMKAESVGGRTQFKLILQMPGGGSPATILSEGEQRAVALASFLAEIKLGKGKGGAVFDDPVSSLDHRRRWEVASRLVAEALERQVIVFTHDIYFLCMLEQMADSSKAPMVTNYIRRRPEGFGVHADELPFDVKGTKDRIKALKARLPAVRAALAAHDEDGHRKLTTETYGLLRLAWERCIEEVLLNGVVQRFGEGVSTLRLKRVIVTDPDYQALDAGMTKSSKFEHDAAAAVGRLPIPAPDELERDIDALETWRAAIVKRGDGVAAAR